MAEKLSIFDRVSVATIAGAGLIEAAQQALKDADQVKATFPALDLNGSWNYVPLALIIIGALSWVSKRVYRRTDQTDIQNRAASLKIGDGSDNLERRVFVGPEVTPKTFQSLYTGRTDLEGKRLSAAYVGKWMKLRGRLQNVSSHFDGIHNIRFEDSDPPSHYTAHTRFNGKMWGDRLETLQIGQEVAVVGRIDSPSRHYFWLMDCEIIPVAEASDAFQMSAKPKRKRARKTDSPPSV